MASSGGTRGVPAPECSPQPQRCGQPQVFDGPVIAECNTLRQRFLDQSAWSCRRNGTFHVRLDRSEFEMMISTRSERA